MTTRSTTRPLVAGISISHPTRGFYPADGITKLELGRHYEAIGEQIVASREAGKLQERLNSDVAAEDNAQRVERELRQLTIPARVRLAYGTNHLQLARGVDAKQYDCVPDPLVSKQTPTASS